MQLFGRMKRVRFAVPEDRTIENEGLVSKETDIIHIELRQLRRYRRVLRRWIMGLSTGLLLVSALLLFVVIKPEERRKSKKSIPEFPTTPITFERDDRFASLTSPESDAAWGSIMPLGDGFIVVDNSHSFGLPPGRETPDGETYDISLFHQLHCLAGIRTFMSATKQAIGRNDTVRVNEIVLDPLQDHMAHCFDYLRQSLMCYGDMTLEWPRTEPDGTRVAVDGWGIEHQCKSWDLIMQYMSEHAG